jgi:hypothetical protein
MIVIGTAISSGRATLVMSMSARLGEGALLGWLCTNQRGALSP